MMTPRTNLQLADLLRHYAADPANYWLERRSVLREAADRLREAAVPLDVPRLILAADNTEGPVFPMSAFMRRVAAEYAASPPTDKVHPIGCNCHLE